MMKDIQPHISYVYEALASTDASLLLEKIVLLISNERKNYFTLLSKLITYYARRIIQKIELIYYLPQENKGNNDGFKTSLFPLFSLFYFKFRQTLLLRNNMI